jgi:hypothetical protein
MCGELHVRDSVGADNAIDGGVATFSHLVLFLNPIFRVFNQCHGCRSGSVSTTITSFKFSFDTAAEVTHLCILSLEGKETRE